MQESRGKKRRGAQNVNSRAHSYNRMSAGARASGSLKAKLSASGLFLIDYFPLGRKK